jgi:FkbM family methyltransferase
MNQSYKRKRLLILLFKSWKALGLIRGTFLVFRYFVLKRERYDISGFKNGIHLRPGSTDLDVLLQFISDRHYDIEYPENIRYILDGGANIGLASIFFANKFPKAQIIAIEPDEGNFQLLKRNTSPYSQIRILQSGLWNKSSWLKIENLDQGEWAFMVSESDSPTSIKGINVTDVLNLFELPGFDLIKLDIEGSEKEVFSDNDMSWFNNLKVLIVEFHDHMRPGGASKVLSAIISRPFQMTLKDENLIFIFSK